MPKRPSGAPRRALQALVRDLAREAARPTDAYRGGFGARLRTAQRLMEAAALALDRWGRAPRQPAEQATMFTKEFTR